MASRTLEIRLDVNSKGRLQGLDEAAERLQKLVRHSGAASVQAEVLRARLDKVRVNANAAEGLERTKRAAVDAARQLNAAQIEAQGVSRALREQRAEARRLANAGFDQFAKQAERAAKDIERSFERAKKMVRSAKAELTQRQADLRLAQAGVSATGAGGLAQASLEARRGVAAVTAEVRRLEAAQVEARAQARNLFTGIADAARAQQGRLDARRLLGLDRGDAIRAEIGRMQAAYRTLAASGTLSAREQVQAFAALEARVAALNREAQSSPRRMAAGVQSISGQLSRLQNAVGGVLAVQVALGSVRALAEYADQWANLGARIRLVTESEREAVTVRSELLAITSETGQSLAATATLYTRLARSLRDAGASQFELLGVTATINKAMVIGGATTQEAAASIIQLSQGLASGTLRGEEFNSVAEQAPIILELLQKHLGKTRGELRAMAEAGQLTTSVVFAALRDGAGEIDAQFQKMPLTIGRASNALGTAFRQLVGGADEATGASNKTAEAINSVAKAVSGLAELVREAKDVWDASYLRAFVERWQQAQDVLGRFDPVQWPLRAFKEQAEARLAEAAAAQKQAEAIRKAELARSDERKKAEQQGRASAATGLPVGSPQLTAAMAEAAGKAQEAGKYVDELSNDLSQKLVRASRDGAQALLRFRAAAIAAAQASGASHEQVLAVSQKFDRAIALQVQAEEADKQKSRGTDVERRAKANEDYVRGLERQAAAVHLSAVELVEQEAAERKLLPAQAARAVAAAQLRVEEEARVKALRDGLEAEERARERASAARPQLDAQFLEATGRHAEAQRLQIEQQFAQQKQDLQALPNGTEGLIKLQVVIDTEVAKAQLASAQTELSRLFTERDAKVQGINAQVQTGVLTERQGREQVLEVTNRYKQSLLDALNATLQLAQQQKQPEVVAQLEAMREEVKNTATEATRLNTQFTEQFATGAANSVVELGQGLAAMATGAGSLGDAFAGAGKNFSEFARNFLKQIAQMIIQTMILKGLEKAGLGGGKGGGLFGGLADLAAGFADGGYTGPGGKYQPAGVVHAGEFVARQEVVRQPGALAFLSGFNRVGMAALEHVRADHFRVAGAEALQRLRGYAAGGLVQAPRSLPSPASSTAAAGGPAARGPGIVRVQLERDALHMTLRDWLEGELAAALATQG